MSSKIKGTLIGLTALVTITGCAQLQAAQQQIAAAHPQAERTDPPVPTFTIDANCDTITITGSGWPDGSAGTFGLGSRPPWGFGTGEGLKPPNGTTVIAVDQLWQRINGLSWDMFMHGPGVQDQEQLGTIDCG